MKTVPSLIALSLALNLALVYAALRPGLETRERTWSPAERPGGKMSLASASGQAETNAEGEGKATPGAAKKDAKPWWSDLESANFDEIEQRLKAEGFSRSEIRSIMGALIGKRFSSRPERPGVPYWRSNRADFSDPKLRQERLQRGAEMQALYRKHVMGAEHFADDPYAVERARARYGSLTMEKLQALSAIEDDYQELQMRQAAGRMPRPGEAGDGEREARELLEKEKEADIAALLTPEEYAEYELRSSDAARRLRSRLESFHPNEAEYRTIFAIQKTYAARLEDRSLPQAQRKAITNQMNSEMTAALGADRAADYLESTQHGSSMTGRLVAQLGLPARVNTQLRALQSDWSQRLEALRRDSALPATERAARMAALGQQAATQVTSLLGTAGYEAYYDLVSDRADFLPPPAGAATR